MRKNILVVIFLIAGLGGGLTGGIFLAPIVFPTVEDYDWEQDYNDLLDDYNDLVDDYNYLFGEYTSILSVLEDPLTAPVIPTMSELISWLAIDDTNTHTYTSNFMCGDFSAMLMIRAKAMNWRMRIMCLSFSFSGDAHYGIQHPSGTYGHVINCIQVQDSHQNGDSDFLNDWIFIEPQNDNVWVITNGTGSCQLYYYWTYYSVGLSTYSHWINYGMYFA
jgi:hypothetical protein